MGQTNIKPKRGLIVCAVAVLLLSACADYRANADSVAKTAGMTRQHVSSGPFVLTSYVKKTKPESPTTIYIEGDGFAWLSESEPSFDPTPHKALALNLAAVDPAPNVVYMARPCQFSKDLSQSCSQDYWTGKRFSREVIASMNQAIDKVLGPTKGRPLHLVGYSGGGAVAVLIAARRDDVASIRTVAGNLDHVMFNRYHEVSQMPASLNAIDVAKKVATIPQIHFSGQEDEIVPTAIARHFRQASGGDCVRVETVSGATHERGWREVWPSLLKKPLVCKSREGGA